MSSLIFRVALNSSKNFTSKSSQKLFSLNQNSNIIRNVTNNYNSSAIKSNTNNLLKNKNNLIMLSPSNLLMNNSNKTFRSFTSSTLQFHTSNPNENQHEHTNSSQNEERSNYEERGSFNILYASILALGTSSVFIILNRENNSILYSAAPSSNTVATGSANSTDISFSQSASKLGSSEIIGEDVEISPLWKRFLAFLIDNTIGGIIFQLTCTLFVGSLEYLIIPVSLLCNGFYEVLLTWQNDGQTLGKYVLGIQTVSSQTTYAVDGKQATLLFVYKLLLNVTFGLDVIWMLCNFTGERQALHNYLTDTIVVQKKKQKKQAKPTVQITTDNNRI